ncbi:uncharacterized protein [Littorina saxatilis]|uniref:Protein kinase domain-containing protein n=1 Tax=Littorina saxatilis TaxID=31220 RepID=A0AAN9GNN3_9CAEN
MMDLDDETRDIFSNLDPRRREILMPRLSNFEGFRIGGIKAETSLMIFVKKRAKPGFVGFVDVTTLAPVTSPQNRGVRVFNVVFNPPVSDSLSELENDFEKQLECVNHVKYGSTARQLLLTATLPHHDYEHNLGAIADCLMVESRTVRHDAAARLERLLIVTNHSEIQAVKHQLLYVVQKTQDVILEPVVEPGSQDNDHIRVCAHLHVLAMSALICRSKHHPTLQECSQFFSWPKLHKKHTAGDVKQEVLKMMHVYYENMEKHLKDQKSKPSSPVCRDRKKFHKSRYFEQVATFFLHLNELAGDQEWSDRGKELLAEIRDLYSIVIKESKRTKPEVRAGIDVLLVRSLVVILASTFSKVRQLVGEGNYDHPLLVAHILAMVVERVSREQLKNLLPHISTIAFHECPDVREIIVGLLENAGCQPLHYTLDHLQASISVTDFHVERNHLAETGGDLDACSWHTFKGRFGTEPAECVLFVHAGQCLAKRSLSGECVDEFKWHQCGDWQRHKQNLETLAKLCPHDNLVKLMAFQLSPYSFYATESIKGRRLLEHLINHRAAHRWLDTSILSRVTHDVILGLEYLASRQIACRDVTAYDMLVSGRSRRGGCAGEKTDILMTDDFTVKLANLGLAHHYRGEGRKALRPVREKGPIPLLWSPPEGLLRGEYSEQSMAYSAGCVMYELWTHGCQPFTSYEKSTADTIRMMLLMPDSVPLIHWPCIPDEVYDVMKRCTSSEPSARPGLSALKQKFMEMSTRKRSKDESVGFEVDGKKDQTRPSFCDDQVQRKHVPERGIPPEIQQIIDDYRTNHSDSYRNMRTSRWIDYATSAPAAAASELSSPYWMETAYKEDYTSVREKYTTKFAKEELPLIEMCAAHAHSELPGVTDWLKTNGNELSLEDESPDHIVHERRYKPSWTLQDAACKGLLATSESGYVAMEMSRHVHVLLSLTRALLSLHGAGWLHRDIRATSILVDCRTGKATLARLGRMYHLATSASYVTDEPFDDTWRWLAPEVLSEGKFGKENDVFMLGTVFWEVLWAREVTQQDPTATQLHYVPFADHEKANILSLVREGKSLPKPDMCPEWLNELSIKCRNPDPAKRPSVEDVTIALEDKLTNKPDPDRNFLSHPKLLSALHEQVVQTDAESIPMLPERFQTKHAKPWRDNAKPWRDSGIGEEARPPQPPRRPVNLGSIKLREKPGPGSSADQAGGYLSPSSEEVQAVVRARFSEFLAGPSQGQAFQDDEDDRREVYSTSIARDDSPRAQSQGLNKLQKSRTYKGPLVQEIPGLPPGPLPSRGASLHGGLLRPLASPLSTMVIDEDHVYSEIKDVARPVPAPKPKKDKQRMSCPPEH